MCLLGDRSAAPAALAAEAEEARGDGLGSNFSEIREAPLAIETSEDRTTITPIMSPTNHTSAASAASGSPGMPVDLLQALQQSVWKFTDSAASASCQHHERNSLELAGQLGHHQQEQLFSAGQLASDYDYCTDPSDDVLSGATEFGFNTMQYNFSDWEPLWVRKEWPDILIRVSFVAPVVLLGILGNLTIIWSICRFKSFRSKPTNIFILSVAIADLITALVCPLAALFKDIYQFYVLGPVLCRLEGSIKITCLLVSAYSLSWLSFIWLRYIVQPCKPQATIRQSWMILAAIWAGSVLMASPLFCWRNLRSRQWLDSTEVWCCELIHISKYYWVFITFFIVYLPTFIMTIILIVILIQMDKFEAKLRRSQTTTTTTTTGSNSSLTIKMKYKRRIIKVLIFYLGISIVCWAPFQCCIIYRHFRKEACLPPGYSDIVFASQLLASVPGTLNPFVFGFMSQPFRKIVSKFWVVKLFDKLLIWRGRPNSGDNHQMEVQGADKIAGTRRQQQQQQQQLQPNQQHEQRANGSNNLAHIINQQTTTRIRSGSSSSKRAPTSANTQPRGVSQSSQPRTNQTHHQSRHRHHNSSKQQQQDGKQAHEKQINGIKTGIPRQVDDDDEIRGCENAAYESTVGDDATDQSRRRDRVDTTSFIREREHHHRRRLQDQLERPNSPSSVVSMDSINIEENLGSGASNRPNNTTHHHHHHHQQQQQQQQQQRSSDNLA